jgi:hypothetical protein
MYKILPLGPLHNRGGNNGLRAGDLLKLKAKNVFEIICKRFNHSRPAVTKRYLGIEDQEVHSTLMNEIG